MWKKLYTKEDGTIGCKCKRRTAPPKLRQKVYEKCFDSLVKEGGDLNTNLNQFLRYWFEASSMNICQTQPLSMMNVPKMTVEFKNESLKAKQNEQLGLYLSPSL